MTEMRYPLRTPFCLGSLPALLAAGRLGRVKNLPRLSLYILHYSQIKKLTTLRRLLYYLGGYHAAVRRVVVL